MADRQYLRPAVSIFSRGDIFFRTKDGDLVSAATTKQGFTIAINPKILKNATTTYEKLAGVYSRFNRDLPRDDFFLRAAKSEDPYEEIINRVDEPIAKAVSELKLKEVMVSKERWRYYPASSTASHLIGFMAYKGDEYTGRYGLEKSFNDVLSRANKQTFVNFFAEIYRGMGENINLEGGRAEGDIVLTIEPTVQNYFETTLAKTRDKYQADSIGGIVVDPMTGEIVAMASIPNFNPGEKQTDLGILSNQMVEGRYEMGSIVKALTMAAGLDAGAVTSKTTYNDTGCLTLNKLTLCNFDRKARGVVSMQEVLNQSLNVGATFVETKMGKDKFRQYFQNFGLAEKTGVDLPNEIIGSLSNLENNQDVEFATASFGQGISITPIGITRALSSLANGGNLITPHVVKEIKYTTGLKTVISPVIERQVLKKQTSEEITRMLVEVVDTKLANGKAKLPHTSVAAKTGTAQMVDATTKKYYADRYLHSFFGYFPAYKPRYLIFLYIKYPKNVQYASETLTDPFMNMTKFMINYYNIPPDR